MTLTGVMRIRATLLERLSGQKTRGRGDHEFAALPRKGDRIVLWNGRGGLDILVVSYVEHSPVKAEPDTEISRVKHEIGPSVTVVIEFLRDGEDDLEEFENLEEPHSNC
jgi:hypothetical protein